jgi:hypothetical protein
MSNLVEEYSRCALEAEINVAWACDPDLRNYWKEKASAYRRLAAAIFSRAAIIEADRSRAA